MKVQTINELNAYFDPGVGHAKGRGRKIRNRSEIIICTDNNIKDIVEQEIERLGPNADLNHLDVSRVTQMDNLFRKSSFNGNISEWDISNVKDMNFMFCDSNFNQDISQWDVSNVKYMSFMFHNSPFNQDISNWNISNVITMFCMFYKSPFNQDISKWQLNPKCDWSDMFTDCNIKQEYKPLLPK